MPESSRPIHFQDNEAAVRESQLETSSKHEMREVYRYEFGGLGTEYLSLIGGT